MQGRNVLVYFLRVLRAARDLAFANCWARRASRGVVLFVRLLRRLRRFMFTYLRLKRLSVVSQRVASRTFCLVVLYAA